jgi:protein-disulfide isomerase
MTYGGKMSKREELREKRRKSQVRQRTIIIILVVAAVLIVSGFLIAPGIIANSAPMVPIINVTPVTRPNENGLSYGSANAPVKVVEYGDFQCPACKQYEDTMTSTMISNYVNTGKVQFAFVPFSFIGPESVSATEAALCANDQGKFWAFHDMLYANQTTENTGAFSDRRITAMDQALGLDMTQFNACYSSHKYQQKTQDYTAQADAKGVTQTPSFFVNDKLVYADTLFQTIDQAVAAAPAK